MSARTRSVSSVIRSVSVQPELRIDDVGPDPRPVLLFRPSAGWARSSAGPLLLDPRVVRDAASSGRGSHHSESLGLECACLAADRPQLLAPCSMLAWPVSIERIDLPFSHISHIAVDHWGLSRVRTRRTQGRTGIVVGKGVEGLGAMGGAQESHRPPDAAGQLPAAAARRQDGGAALSARGGRGARPALAAAPAAGSGGRRRRPRLQRRRRAGGYGRGRGGGRRGCPWRFLCPPPLHTPPSPGRPSAASAAGVLRHGGWCCGMVGGVAALWVVLLIRRNTTHH
jgi:hypothetical protein